MMNGFLFWSNGVDGLMMVICGMRKGIQAC